MIIVYPEQFKINVPTHSRSEIIFDGDDLNINEKFSGLYDTVFLVVNHSEDSHALNYNSLLDQSRNIHHVTTFIDCRYHSSNLDIIINMFQKWEDIWNER